MQISEAAKSYIERLVDSAAPNFEVADGGCQKRQRLEACAEMAKFAGIKAVEAHRNHITADDIQAAARLVIGRRVAAGFITQLLTKVPTTS